jgi:hypothetical protein
MQDVVDFLEWLVLF